MNKHTIQLLLLVWHYRKVSRDWESTVSSSRGEEIISAASKNCKNQMWFPTLQHTHFYWPWPYSKVTTAAILLWLYLSSMGSSSILLSELKAVWTGRWTWVFIHHPPIFSSLINCMVSMDVKHHWTIECTFILWILVSMILVLFQDCRCWNGTNANLFVQILIW